ncbi:hypothetical protein [Halopseudomonas salegens]|uniref:Uncharacterized protein n=1 Tax=Halopseudomonas salegens TaxID=1434072 RepID=A0A1H2EIP5_9GAMM|nr:hypothetical protein [Halopseudomonas salegens]SDT94995.1 hypothetical protein SAMN05216210_0766 [Halopseudomonas salegens]
MKRPLLATLLCSSLLAAAMPAVADECTPEAAMEKGAELAATLERVAYGDADKLQRINQKLIELQVEDPTRSDHTACEAYDRIIAEVEELEKETDSDSDTQ